ncbi:hypothetical protein IEQ34_014185 [Dendrobium chrysotoxum]|uniref:NADH dehydrogenase subunit 2 n=1 Tax=Dendrobium chrysotoxum TaxID=161865 RepID=A0AAV7GKX3_DENCH|nr:hypothetical protein IEQ34_014185 [Dendrobium chrysotoxum]
MHIYWLIYLDFDYAFITLSCFSQLALTNKNICFLFIAKLIVLIAIIPTLIYIFFIFKTIGYLFLDDCPYIFSQMVILYFYVQPNTLILKNIPTTIEVIIFQLVEGWYSLLFF